MRHFLPVFSYTVNLSKDEDQIWRRLQVGLAEIRAKSLEILNPFLPHPFLIVDFLLCLNDLTNLSFQDFVGDDNECPWLGVGAAWRCSYEETSY